LNQTKSISVADTVSFTSIVTLYDVLDIYLKDSDWKNFKRFRPSEDKLKEIYNKSIELWEVLADSFRCIKENQNSSSAHEVAGKYRNRDGGHLLFRPVGLLIFIKVLRKLIDSGSELRDATKKLSKVPMEISENIWAGLLWDVTNRRMITAGENQKVAVKLLFYSVGGDLSKFKSTPQKLITELSGILNKDEKEVKLPRYVLNRRRQKIE
jgi:DNA sulfur modification protein DndB